MTATDASSVAFRVVRHGRGDAAAARRLLVAFKGGSRTIEDMEEFLASGSSRLYGAYVGDDPAGFALVYRLGHPDGRADMLFLYDIEVRETYRRRGIGSALVRELQREAQGKLFVLTNESNEAAMRFYEALGGTRPHSDDVLFALGGSDE